MACSSSTELCTHGMEGMVLLQLCQALQVGHGTAEQSFIESQAIKSLHHL